LKKEVTIDDHRIPLDELIERYQTNIEEGLTTEKAREALEKNGPNSLTPPAEVPEWVKFAKLLFGGFSALLWVNFLKQWRFLLQINMDLIGCCYTLFDCLWSSSRFRSHNTKR